MDWFFHGLGILGLALMATAYLYRKALRSRVPDAAMLEELKAHSPSPGEPHQFEFFLVSNSSEEAAQLRHFLHHRGHSFDERLSGDAEAITFVLRKQLVPELQTLLRLRTEFEGLAAVSGSRYDGWGAELLSRGDA